MGGLFSKIEKTQEEISNEIKELNKITNNELFYKKTLYKMNFGKQNNFYTNLTGKNINCQIVKIKIKKL